MNPNEDVAAAPASAPPRLAQLVLRLLSTKRRLPSDACASCGEDDWRMLLRMLRQHRLEPMLHWRLTHEHSHVEVPQDVRERLREAFRKATLRNLTIRVDLQRVHDTLRGAGIDHLVLKGPFLALHAYPHPALRPMRDLDVLVPKAELTRAFELLLANGCRRSPRYPGDPQSFFLSKKHLPPVLAPSGRVLLELHGRLIPPEELGQAPADAFDEPSIWARSVGMSDGDSPIRAMSPTDLLLHLIVHAAYDHRFDNGPLVLTDVNYLLERHPIDWPLFQEIAALGRWTRGCRLLLRMTDLFHGLSEENRAGGGIAQADPQLDEIAEAAALLTLRDVDTRTDQETLGAMDLATGWRGKLAVLLDKAFPPRHRIAAQFPVDPKSPAVLLGYVRRWWYVSGRAVEMSWRLGAATRLDRARRRVERRRIDTLERWLRQD